jgi:hypothetical protein
MSVLTRRHIRGVAMRITRPTAVRQADGSTSRVGLVNGEAPEPTVLQASEKVQLSSLTTERKEHVFGASAKATDTVRVPIAWGVRDGDMFEVLDGPETGARFKVEKVIAYRMRPRMTHAECALVQLPTGAR